MRKFLLLLSLVLTLLLVGLQLLVWHAPIIGWCLLFIYLWIVSGWWQVIYRDIFGWEKDWATRILMIFFIISLLGFAVSAVDVVYRVTPSVVWGALAAVGFTSLGLTAAFRKATPKQEDSSSDGVNVFPKNFILVVIFFLLTAIGVFIIFQSRSSALLMSPWQAINLRYLTVYFFITVIIGALLFSRYRAKTVLMFLIVYSFLQHLYLPLSHENPWGGDVWRHIGVEEKLRAGRAELPVIFGGEAKFRSLTLPVVGTMSAPEALLIPQKYSYGQFWSVSLIFSEMTGVNLISLNKWLMPVLWSLAMPIILFRLGSILFSSRRWGLFLPALAGATFPFQALGALTLPVSLGYLVFFFAFTLWLEYVESGDKRQRVFVVGITVLMLFGYTLHLLLLIASMVLYFMLKKILLIRNSLTRKSALLIVNIVSVFFFPVIELVSRVSFVPKSLNVWQSAKQFIGQWSGWYFARTIRPHAILSGNFFFSHTPIYAFVPNIFLNWRWWIIPTSFLIWGVALFGIWRSQKFDTLIKCALCEALSALVIGGYIISWYALAGDRLFVRRLDAMLVILVLIFFLFGARSIVRRYGMSQSTTVIVIFLFAWLATATYASGPNLRVVSRDEFSVAQHLAQIELQHAPPYCVLADTWVLLPLQAISANQIVGGGFPIEYQFAQPDRDLLLHEMLQYPRRSIFSFSQEKTGTARCRLALPRWLLSQEKKAMIDSIFASSSTPVGDWLIW